VQEVGARGDDPLARAGRTLAAQRAVVPPSISERLVQLKSLDKCTVFISID
jgi:hypothetical protein